MKPYAVFTIVQNESFFLRLWCNYYCSLSSEVDVFVLDDSSTDGSVEEARSRHRVSVRTVAAGRRYDLSRLRKAAQEFQRELLRTHEVVIYTDVDEFLLPSGDEGLLPFLERFRSGGDHFVRSTGWHCIHVDREPPLEPRDGEGILRSRDHMWRFPRYDKTLVSKIPLTWSNGFHHCVEAASVPPDPGLCLMHAWMVDQALFTAKKREYLGLTWRQLVANYTRVPATRIPERWKRSVLW